MSCRLVNTTPSAKRATSLLGGVQQAGVSLTHSEVSALKKLYGVTPESNPLLDAGALRNVLRRAEHDGLRMVAWLARYLDPGEDPMKFLVQAVIDAGGDVDSADVEWVQGASDEDAL